MLRTFLLAITWIALSAALAVGDDASDRQAAANLMTAGKHEEALSAFTKLAENGSDEQKSDALVQAALCAVNLKRPDEALALAKQIPSEPISKTLQLDLMGRQQKWPLIVEQFKDDKIETWPLSVRGNAFYHRGVAAFFAKNGALAESDLTQATKFLTDDNTLGLAWNTLGHTYRDLIHDDAKAIDAYRGAYKTRNEYKHAASATAVAAILTKDKKFDEAMQELRKISMVQMEVPHWRVSMLIAYAEIYAARGQKQDAIAKYEEALRTEGIPAFQKPRCEKALEELRSAKN